MRSSRSLALFGLLLSCAGATFACPHMRLHSHYEGGGWFRYDVTFFRDHFIGKLEGVRLRYSVFPGFVTYGPTPSGWQTATSGPVGWAATDAMVVTSNETYSFRAQSTNDHWRVNTDNTSYLFEFFFWSHLHDDDTLSGDEVDSIGLAGFTKLHALVPCSAGEADGSPPALVYDYELWQDVKIDDLVSVSNDIRGIAFTWQSPCKVRLQASDDFVTWTNITDIVSSGPSTVWTSSVPLSAYGRFFRLVMNDVDP